MNKSIKKRHIELFAGCGGLSLGLESEGIELFFANELSPMAAETFAYNILNEDLDDLANARAVARSTIWLNSRYRKDFLRLRLKENPQTPPSPESRFDDLPSSASDLFRKLIVGSITDLNDWLQQSPSLLVEIQNQMLDVVSGGPPCQSFSMAGLRQHANHRNTLPWEFVRFVGMVGPKVAVLENVTGILRPFSIEGDKKGTLYHAWHEVAKAFVQKGYVPICLHVNAKYVGVAQNRPRFLLFAIRRDVFDRVQPMEELKAVSENSLRFYEKAKQNTAISIENSQLKCWDIEKNTKIFESHLFSAFLQFGHPRTESNNPHLHSVQEAINDFAFGKISKINNRYVKLLEESFSSCNQRKQTTSPQDAKNQEQRLNTIKVRQRFRLYQIIAKIGQHAPEVTKEVQAFINNSKAALSEQSLRYLLKESFLLQSRLQSKGRLERFPPERGDELIEHIASLRTKKQTQRALIAGLPAPAALSIPDDGCHYSTHIDDIRTLSVREMARIQSFPDWFEFRSKVTTGGQMRKFQVPQYTQVGNAVPPLLGKAIGKVINSMLDLG